MKTLIKTANSLAYFLNNDADYVSSNWWDAATEVAGDYYSDELTCDADPASRSNVLVLTDGDQTVAVCFDDGAQEWNVELDFA